MISDDDLAAWADAAARGSAPARVVVLAAELREARGLAATLSARADSYFERGLAMGAELRLAQAEREEMRRNWHVELSRAAALERRCGQLEREIEELGMGLESVEAEFWQCPGCRAPLVVVNGVIRGQGLVMEFHDRLTPSGVAPVRVTVHTAGCTTRNHLAEAVSR